MNSTEIPQPPESSGHLARRSIVRGAAWSLPVIAIGSAFPAMDASVCSAVTFRWLNPAAGRTVGSKFTSGSVGGVTVAVGITGPNAGTFNNTISPDAGGYNGYTSYYEQQLTAAAKSSSTPLSTTLTFSQPVNDLSFSFFDLDQNDTTSNPGFTDGVSITSHTSSSGAFTYVNGSAIIGTGTTSTPWQPRPNTGQLEGQEGNVAVMFQIPVTSFTWSYRDLTTKTDADEYIGMTNLTFTPTSC